MRVAELSVGLILETGKFFGQLSGSLGKATGAISKAGGVFKSALGALTSPISLLTGSLSRIFEFTVGNLLANGISRIGSALASLGADSVMTAARVREMEVVLEFMGEQAGMAEGEALALAQAIADAGIRMDVAQQVAAQFIRRNIDASKAIDLVRVAQGAAIIAQEDSSDTLQALIDGITTNNVLMLRRRGILVDSTVAFEEYMKAEGKAMVQTVDNSQAIADQETKLGFLEAEYNHLLIPLNQYEHELDAINHMYQEGSPEHANFIKKLGKARLAVEKKAFAIDKARQKLDELRAGHGAVSKSIKVSTDDMSAEQRTAAFLNAVLKEGEPLLDLYGKAMEEPGKRARSLKRDVFNLKNAIGKPFLDAFGTGVDALRNFVKAVTASAEEGGVLHGVLSTLGQTAATFFQDLVVWVEEYGPIVAEQLVPSLMTFRDWIIENGPVIWEKFLEMAAAAKDFALALMEAGMWIAENAPMIRDRTVEIAEGIITAFEPVRAWFETNWPTIAGIILTVWEIIKAAVSSAASVIVDQVWPKLQAAFNVLTETLASFGISWSDVWQAVKTATTYVAYAIGALLLALVGVVVGVVTGIAAALETVAGGLQTFASGVQLMLDGITQLAIAFINFWKSVFAGDFIGAVESMKLSWQGLYTLFKGIFTSMQGVVETFVLSVTDLLLGFVGGVISFFTNLYDELVGGSIIPDMINAIVGWFESLPERILGALSGLAEGISSLLGGLFGPLLEFDPAQVAEVFALLQAGVQKLLELWQLFMQTLNETWLLFSEYLLYESWPLMQETWMVMTVAMHELWSSALGAMLVEFQKFLQAVLLGVGRMIAEWARLRSVINAAASAVNKFITLIKSLISGGIVSGLLRVASAFRAIKKAAEAAAEACKEAKKACRKAAEATGAGTAPGAQAGMWRVPREMPVTVHPEEAILPAGVADLFRAAVAAFGGRPRGGMAMGGETNYYFDMTVNTNAGTATVIEDYDLMKNMLGA